MVSLSELVELKADNCSDDEIASRVGCSAIEVHNTITSSAGLEALCAVVTKRKSRRRPANHQGRKKISERIFLAQEFLKEKWVYARETNAKWSRITWQSSLVDIGAMSQGLVSLATWFRGSLSAARGDDVKMDMGPGEVKGATRVEQLGRCRDCGGAVSGTDSACRGCGSVKIKRMKDSHWLVRIRDSDHLVELLDQEAYFLVLFEPSLSNPRDVDVSIFLIDTSAPGFRKALIWRLSRDYDKLNLHPYHLKFAMMKPQRILLMRIDEGGGVRTLQFPGRDAPTPVPLVLQEYYKTKTITFEQLGNVAAEFGIVLLPKPEGGGVQKTMRQNLIAVDEARLRKGWSDDMLADRLAYEVYPDSP